ncbi:MAG: hypothetical protein HC828_01465 [Blastochloris sp.]|nr:hypothetical protein [Blastochloris sp.]
MHVTRSLEDYRQEQLLDVGEFADWLGVTQQTYRRLLQDPQSVRMKTKRQVRDRLNVSPYLVAELTPRPSPVLMAQIQAAYDEANVDGWVAYDPDSLEPTGEVFDGVGNLMNEKAPR